MVLSYESIKVVLEHMDPNTRFQISQFCPTIRNTDKLIPLYINHFSTWNHTITVNDHKHKFGMIHHYPVGVDAPLYHQFSNILGGVTKNLDEYGLRIYDMEDFQARRGGDGKFRTSWGQDRDWKRFVLQREISFLDVLSRRDDEVLQHQIDVLRTQLKPYNDHEAQVSPPFTIYLQLTVSNPSGNRVTRWSYGKTIEEGVNSWLNRFLVGRKFIYVKQWDIRCDQVPSFLNLIVRRLTVRDNIAKTILGVMDVLDGRPVECLDTIKQFVVPPILNHPLEKSAKKLILTIARCREEVLMNCLSELPNRHVHVTAYQISVPCCMLLIPMMLRNWMDVGREVGCLFTVELEQDATVDALFALVVEQFTGEMIGSRHLTIPFNFASNIEMSCVTEVHDDELMLLKLEVVSKSTE